MALALPLLLLLLAPLGTALLLLLRWFFEPVTEARRLAREPDPAAENTFEDPNAADPRERRCVK